MEIRNIQTRKLLFQFNDRFMFDIEEKSQSGRNFLVNNAPIDHRANSTDTNRLVRRPVSLDFYQITRRDTNSASSVLFLAYAFSLRDRMKGTPADVFHRSFFRRGNRATKTRRCSRYSTSTVSAITAFGTARTKRSVTKQRKQATVNKRESRLVLFRRAYFEFIYGISLVSPPRPSSVVITTISYKRDNYVIRSLITDERWRLCNFAIIIRKI